MNEMFLEVLPLPLIPLFFYIGRHRGTNDWKKRFWEIAREVMAILIVSFYIGFKLERVQEESSVWYLLFPFMKIFLISLVSYAIGILARKLRSRKVA
jgi:hypothetical protein